MSSREDRRFIEAPGFPADVVNEASSKEKQGGGRPPYWEMVFWWTRKPLAGARSVVAGALLPADTNSLEFKYNLHLTESVAHRKNPLITPKWRERLSRARLLDPFAGFGSIPLEAVRLGVGEVVAVELLPTAYVLLKAVLEYPKWAVERGLGEKLVKDVERWGEWVAKKLQEDPDIRELYDDDVAVYIGTWEIRCPHCGRQTPLVGNWWLARVSKETVEEEGEEEEGTRSGVFSRLAWMEPVKAGDQIVIKIVDLNKELGRKILKAKVNSGQGTVVVDGKTYRVSKSNIDARRETAICLHCNNQIRKGARDWIVKEAIREWNQKLEQYLSRQIDIQTLKETTKARPRILAKVKIVNGDLEFQPATQEDQEKLWKALEKLRQLWGDPDIPAEELWKYTASGGGALSIWTWGFDKFYKLFNPRQLLTLVKLVKLIREAGKRVEEEKLREGWSREEALKYAEAVTTYLAIALLKHINYNSIVTSTEPTQKLIRETLAFRGIAMTWNWVEEYPIVDILGSYKRSLKSVIDGLSYLVSAVRDSPSRVRVLFDDATVLSKLDGEKFDVIVTDPPYRDDVPYAELSDFYYVWLKRALSDVIDVGGLAIRQPRFVPEAFFRDGAEIEVQWKYFADKEVSESSGRSKFFGGDTGSLEYFKKLLTKSFQTMAGKLADNGILVTYYAHTSPDAWEALLDAGWRGAGLRITVAHAMVTESKDRVTARGKAGLDVSIIAVWRKGVSGQVLAGEAYSKALEECTEYAGSLLKKGFDGVNLFVSVLGCVLFVFTRYEKIVGVKNVKELVEEHVYPATAEAIARALGGGKLAGRLSSMSLFYLLGKVLIARRPQQVRRTLDRSTMAILAIGTRNEMGRLKEFGLVEQESDKFRLLEPAWDQRDPAGAVRSALEKRGVNLRNPVVRTAVDLLHLLEYYAVTMPKSEFTKRAEELRTMYPALYEETLGLARILAEVLQSNDPERELVNRVVDTLAPRQVGIDKWVSINKVDEE
ncbi:DUF1156 domain-containing protein [Stygiolobus azoricus]|uniref:DUF1156 domain-containing protein n=1 Tax=Stygiolobus azoricus TaxID=41675 RepID=UPI0018C8AA26|nr:DUF1156 domain-containing protein [Stygiolobus azoricus]